MLQRLHQLLRAMKTSGLSLVSKALALVTHLLIPPVLSLHTLPIFYTPPPHSLPTLIAAPRCLYKRAQKKFPTHLCLVFTPIPPIYLCPSLFCTPPPYPKGPYYPPQTQTLLLHLPLLSLASVITSQSVWLVLNNSWFTNCFYFSSLHVLVSLFLKVFLKNVLKTDEFPIVQFQLSHFIQRISNHHTGCCFYACFMHNAFWN